MVVRREKEHGERDKEWTTRRKGTMEEGGRSGLEWKKRRQSGGRD